MKKIITVIILITASVLTQLIAFFPWWSFLAPVFLLGVILPLEKWKVPAFLTGFAAGFLMWTLSTFYFEDNGEIIKKISAILEISHILLYVLIGLLGGCLMGLAFYSGYLLRKGKEVLKLDLTENT